MRGNRVSGRSFGEIVWYFCNSSIMEVGKAAECKGVVVPSVAIKRRAYSL